MIGAVEAGALSGDAAIAALALVIVAVLGLVGTVLGVLLSNRSKISRMDDTLNRHHDSAPTLGEFLASWDGTLSDFREFMGHFRDQWDGLREEVGNAAKLNAWSQRVEQRLESVEKTGEATWDTVQTLRLELHDHLKWCQENCDP